MSSPLTFEQVAPLIAEHLGVAPDKVTAEASLIDDLGADSLDIIELAMALEEIGGGVISDAQIEKIERVEQLIAAANGT